MLQADWRYSARLPAHAVGTRYPFCIQGNEFPGLSNCTFTSYDQCMATASGRFLTCVANPYFAGGTDDPYAYRNRYRRFPPLLPASYYAAQLLTRGVGGAPLDHKRANVSCLPVAGLILFGLGEV